MRLLRVLGLTTVLAAGAGCGLFERMKSNTPKGGAPVAKVTSAQLVDYLNAQAARLQTVTYDRATVTARQGLVSMPSLRGDLAAAQPRNFRMRGQGGMVSAKIDLGSNDEQFWLYVDAPAARQTFVFASHTDFDGGRVRLPDGIPFEPDWVMQALGMKTFPRDAKYDPVKLDERNRTYTLSWAATTPAGAAIRKEVVFAADDADSSHDQPQVRRHVVKDVKGNVVCSAEVKSAKTVPVGGADSRSGHAFVVQYPKHVVLKCADRNLRLKKLGEESAELLVALADDDARRSVEESADLVYHVLVALRAIDASLADLRRELARRGAVVRTGSVPGA